MSKVFEYDTPAKIPKDAFHVWQFIDLHPECKDMDEEEIQEMDGMWFRKAVINRAMTYEKPELNLYDAFYPSEQDCVLHTLKILKKQKKYTLKQVVTMDIQYLQNTVPGLSYRKKITRQALAMLKKECI
jgi:hypothetical protein